MKRWSANESRHEMVADSWSTREFGDSLQGRKYLGLRPVRNLVAKRALNKTKSAR